MRGAVVLMYHRVSEALPACPEERTYTIPAGVFRRHVEHIASSGKGGLGLDAIEGGGFPDGSVFLTVDDGFDTDRETVLPLLQDFDLKATFFVSPALLGRQGYLSWRGVEGLAAAGMEIGAHGLDHTLLDGVGPAELERQLVLPKQMLERRLGIEIRALSLPGGRGGLRAAADARRAGYRLIFGSRPARLHSGGTASMLPRFALRQGISKKHFCGLLAQERGALWREGLRYAAAETFRNLLGGRWYRRLSREVAWRRSRGGESKRGKEGLAA